MSSVEQKADVALLNALTSCSMLLFQPSFTGVSLLYCCTLGTSAVSAPVPGCGAEAEQLSELPSWAEHELCYMIFVVQFHRGSLCGGVFPFGTVCRVFDVTFCVTSTQRGCKAAPVC